jgi:hypothetical protein
MAIGSLNLTPEDKLVEKLEASLEKTKEASSSVPPTLPPKPTYKFNDKSIKRTNVRTDERTDERMTVRTNEQRNERTNGRKKIRHAFDIFEDQLIALKEAQLTRQKVREGRYNLGDLVQEALDMFLATERTKVQVNE